MPRLLYSALRDMKAVIARGPTLVRPDSSLDLFVTTTDLYGYETAIPTGAGGVSHLDHSYRQLLGFRYEPGGTDDFGDDAVAALSFAARATASFPGAFPPVSLETFASAIRDISPAADADLSSVPALLRYGSPDGQPGGSWYVDGGVLDNGPFDHVIDAIAAKPAATETAREIVYVEPDPQLPPAGPAPQPTWFKTVWASRATIPQHEPLVGTLVQLRDMNVLIAEVGRIAELQMSEVLPLLDDSGTDVGADYTTVLMTAGQVRQKAKEASGAGYATYCRLKAAAVADPVAAAVGRHFRYPDQSNEEYFVAAVLGAWVRSQRAWLDGDPATVEHALGAAFAYRAGGWAGVIVGVDPDPANAASISQWARDYWQELHPTSAGGAYVSFMMDEGQERVRASYRGNYDRLAQVKHRYDPDNVFHINQNIRPASG